MKKYMGMKLSVMAIVGLCLCVNPAFAGENQFLKLTEQAQVHELTPPVTPKPPTPKDIFNMKKRQCETLLKNVECPPKDGLQSCVKELEEIDKRDCASNNWDEKAMQNRMCKYYKGKAPKNCSNNANLTLTDSPAIDNTGIVGTTLPAVVIDFDSLI